MLDPEASLVHKPEALQSHQDQLILHLENSLGLDDVQSNFLASVESKVVGEGVGEEVRLHTVLH